MMDYQTFLSRKTQLANLSGFEPLWMPDFLFDFQASLVDWAVRKGRAAIFADCGLGKGPMALVWAENIVRKTNRSVLILTPLAVAPQFLREGEKFEIGCVRSHDGSIPSGASIVVANYDRLHHFDPKMFAGVVCDESSCIKHFDTKRTADIKEFLREMPYRLLCTATAAPNDYVELGNSSEVLGELGFQDMITRFFKKELGGGGLGWNRMSYRMRAYAANDFWRWVCSWARAVRKPSDLGFDDGPFLLPELQTTEHVVTANERRPGFLFDIPAITLQEQREERRRSLRERCERVASLVEGTGRPAVLWCHLNDEGDLLEDLVLGSVQVSGSDRDEVKEERFFAFADRQFRVLVTKPEIAGFGLNWQHCSHQTFFPSHSFERYYQAVRRCWRFGQTRPVQVDIVTSEGERGVLENLNRKAIGAAEMFDRIVRHMNDSLAIDRSQEFSCAARLPDWLTDGAANHSSSLLESNGVH